MSIFDRFKSDYPEEEYDDSNDRYDDYDYDDEDYDEDDIDDGGVALFANDPEPVKEAPKRKSSGAPTYEAPKPSYTSRSSASHSAPTYSAPSYTPPSSSYSAPKGTSSRSSSSYSAPKSSSTSNVFKMDSVPVKKTVEEIYIADLKEPSEAMSVADLVKEKRFALIVNLKQLKSDDAKKDAYSSVVNFIDGVCYVTDSVFKEITPGSSLFLIYHKDITLNEGLNGFSSSNQFNF